MTKFTDQLSQPGILIADGATGTMLQRAGLPAGAPSESWILQNPDGVRTLHSQYLKAGATLILTNTFGGTRVKLNKGGLGDKVGEINKKAAQIAKEMAGEKAFVLGDIGPSGELLEPFGSLNIAEAIKIFAEQAKSLAEGGVDGILIETMSDLNEAKAAFDGARSVTNLPILVSMSFDTRGRTMMGVKPSVAVKELWSMGAAVVGANCGRTLSETLTAIQEMRQSVPEAVLLAKPNAGLPHTDGSDTVYDVTPQIMAEYALLFAKQKVKIFGGCCGSNPDHIQAIAQVLKQS